MESKHAWHASRARITTSAWQTPRLVHTSVPGYSSVEKSSSPSPSWALDFCPKNNSSHGHRKVTALSSFADPLVVVERSPRVLLCAHGRHPRDTYLKYTRGMNLLNGLP